MRNLLLVLAACHSNTAATTPDAAAVSVAGHWKSDCTPNGQGGAISLDFTNTADHWSVAYVTYGDASCTTPVVTANIAGTYTIGAASSIVSGAYDAVFSFDTKTLTPNVQALADTLNGMGCGTFTVGQPTDVYTNGCPGFGMYPKVTCTADYDLVSITGTTLRFGNRPADNNMCSADKRPTALGLALSRY
ncbi:MAG: hypothetical protein QM831_39440 [Kofleriaceae bacterium]